MPVGQVFTQRRWHDCNKINRQLDSLLSFTRDSFRPCWKSLKSFSSAVLFIFYLQTLAISNTLPALFSTSIDFMYTTRDMIPCFSHTWVCKISCCAFTCDWNYLLSPLMRGFQNKFLLTVERRIYIRQRIHNKSHIWSFPCLP